MKFWVKKMLWLLVMAMFPIGYGLAENIELCEQGNEQCTLVLLSEVHQQHKSDMVILNDNRAQRALSPFSTFKIANALIALETGQVKNTEQPLSYDQARYPMQPWWPVVWKQEHYNLASAFKVSMVAIFRQLASDMGAETMQTYLDRFSYGNHDISSGIDNFWLDGSLKISAVEQVQFLQKLYHNQFSLQENTFSSLKNIMLVNATDNYKLYAKTGAGKVADGTMLGWYVGFVENAVGIHYFAFNFNTDTYAEMKASREKIVMNHLSKAGII